MFADNETLTNNLLIGGVALVVSAITAAAVKILDTRHTIRKDEFATALKAWQDMFASSAQRITDQAEQIRTLLKNEEGHHNRIRELEKIEDTCQDRIRELEYKEKIYQARIHDLEDRVKQLESKG